MIFLKLNRGKFHDDKQKMYCIFNWRSYLSTGYNFIRTKLDRIKLSWINHICPVDNLAFEQPHLSSGQKLSRINHICPVDNFIHCFEQPDPGERLRDPGSLF